MMQREHTVKNYPPGKECRRAYQGSNLMRPRMLQICTSTQHTKHWKNSNAMGALKLKLLSVALLSSTMLAEAAHSGQHQ